VTALLAHGLECALTGGLAIDAQLRVHGRSVEPRALNDIEFVVEAFASIPGSLAASFLPHHVHPAAIDGKTLLQLVDQQRAIRIDLFHTLASTLLRAIKLDDEVGHRQQVPGTVDAASRAAARLLDAHPELIVVEEYSRDVSPCEPCREHGPFRPAAPSRIIEILGYC
jgi:hypothetical protein